MFEQINPIADGIAVDFMRHRMADFRKRHPEFDVSADIADALVFPNSTLKRHLRNKRGVVVSKNGDLVVGPGEKEAGRSLAWVLRWQERRKERKVRKLSRRAEGKIGKEDRIVSYEKQALHKGLIQAYREGYRLADQTDPLPVGTTAEKLVFVEDEYRTYRAQLNFLRILSKLACVPDSMRITEEDLNEEV